MTTSCLLDPHMPVFVPAGSTTHAHAHTCWIPPAHPCSCPMDPRTPVSVPDGSTHARMHAPGPHACLLAGSHTCWLTGSPRALACRVSIHAHTGPMHARLHRVLTPAHLRGPHTRWLAGSPSALAHGISIPHALGPCMRARTRSPCAFTRRVPTCTRSRGLHTCMLWAHAHALAHRVSMHMYMCPLDASCVHPSAVCIGRVICSSSTVL